MVFKRLAARVTYESPADGRCSVVVAAFPGWPLWVTRYMQQYISAGHPVYATVHLCGSTGTCNCTSLWVTRYMQLYISVGHPVYASVHLCGSAGTCNCTSLWVTRFMQLNIDKSVPQGERVACVTLVVVVVVVVVVAPTHGKPLAVSGGFISLSGGWMLIIMEDVYHG